MSGLSNNTNYNSTLVSIVQGSFRIRCNEGDRDSVSRVNKSGNVVYETKYSNLSGYIKSMVIEDTEFGKKMNLIILADKDYKLSLGYADSLTVNIYKMLPNINPHQEILITLQRKPDDKGVDKTSLFISQEGHPIKWAFTRDNPNGMPAMEQIMVKGEKVWDNTKQVVFLYEKSVLPFIKTIPSSFTESNDDWSKEFTNTIDSSAEEESIIPF